MSLPQPVPPSWKDLGKSSNDLLSKDYPIGTTALEVKTITPSGTVFKVTGNNDQKNVITGAGEAKYSDKKNGITFTQAWNTANVLSTTIELENQLAQGLKLDINSSLSPESSGEKASTAKSAILSAAYKQPGVHSRASLNVFKGPTFTADAVLGQNGFLIGTEATYNVSSGKVSRYAAGFGFSAPEYAINVIASDNMSRYTASYYHRVSRDVEAGGRAFYDTAKSADGVKLEVGTKVLLDNAAFVKAKINNGGLLSLGYTQILRPGVKAQFGLALDTQKLNANVAGSAHTVGASFTFEG